MEIITFNFYVLLRTNAHLDAESLDATVLGLDEAGGPLLLHQVSKQGGYTDHCRHKAGCKLFIFSGCL